MEPIFLEALRAHIQTATGYTTLVAPSPYETDIPSEAVTVSNGNTPISIDTFKEQAVCRNVANTHSLMQVGELQSEAIIRVHSPYPAKRDQMQRQLEDLFYQDELALSELTLYATTYDATDGQSYTGLTLPLSFTLDNAQWSDEKVFTDPAYAQIRVATQSPKLVSKQLYTMDTIKIRFVEDPSQATTDIDID